MYILIIPAFVTALLDSVHLARRADFGVDGGTHVDEIQPLILYPLTVYQEVDVVCAVPVN